jgi:hypothetical protein
MKDLATWVGELATAGALGVTATIFGMQLYDRRRQQADRVAVWPDQRHVEQPSDSTEFHSFGFICRNDSDGPIFDIIVEAEGKNRGVLARPGVLPPGEEFSGQLHIKYGPLPHLVVSFTDYAGRCWHKRRVGRSKLQRTRKGSIIGIPVTVERQNPPTSC